MSSFRTHWLTGILFPLTFVIFASSTSAETISSPKCLGQTIQGPWYSFLLPDGMVLGAETNQPIKTDSVWIESGIGHEKFSFFLFAPRHGGKPYQAYAGSVKSTMFIEHPNKDGTRQMFSVEYQDGSRGLFEGTSQKITGIRVLDRPMTEEDFGKFNCFSKSIEQFAN